MLCWRSLWKIAIFSQFLWPMLLSNFLWQAWPGTEVFCWLALCENITYNGWWWFVASENILSQFPDQRPIVREHMIASADIFVVLHWWFGTRWWYLMCISNGDNMVWHSAINKTTIKWNKISFFFQLIQIGCRIIICVVVGGLHDDVMKWKHFPRNWPFVWGIHRSPVNSPHKGQWCGALMFSLICFWINDRVNNGEAGDLRRYHAHYDVIVMFGKQVCFCRITTSVYQ